MNESGVKCVYVCHGGVFRGNFRHFEVSAFFNYTWAEGRSELSFLRLRCRLDETSRFFFVRRMPASVDLSRARCEAKIRFSFELRKLQSLDTRFHK